MRDLLADLEAAAAAALVPVVADEKRGLVPAALPLARATKAEFGDYQISAALQLAKPLGKPPRDLARAIADGLAGHAAVEKTEVAGPGFVNIHLRSGEFARRAADLLADEHLGLRPIFAGQTVVIDYSSPNVAKPMHIGHIRSTILGEALKRALRSVGYTVIGDNHLGDWGTQFGKLIVAYRRWVDPAAYEREPVAELLRLYIKYQDEEKRQWADLGGKPARAQAAAAEAPGGGDGDGDDGDVVAPEANDQKVPEILLAARRELVALQGGDAGNKALWQSFVDASLREFARTYARLGVAFDVVHGESFYNDRLADTVAALVGAGIAEESRGALIVTFDKARDGEDMPPTIVRKADGGFNYATSDIACVRYREERWAPSRILYVTDERQQLHFRQFFAASRRLGARASLEHVWFGLMRLPEGTFSTRDGNVIGLESLLDEAERRALDVAREVQAQRAARDASPQPERVGDELDEAALREVARVVGLGAVKYNDLSKDRQTLVTFTWDKALALSGNTAPYLQYAYARVRSILRRAAAEGVPAPAPGDAVVLGSTVERDLARRLLAYPDAVEQVARTLRPNVLCDYLYDLATGFSTFYADHPVLKAEDAALRTSRLALTELVARVLRAGLELLGIETLDRM